MTNKTAQTIQNGYANTQQSKTPSIYRKVEKKYKRKGVPKKQKKKGVKPPPCDFTDVIDFHEIDKNTSNNQEKIVQVDISDFISRAAPSESSNFAKPVSEWNVYSLKDYPGFYFIPNPFTNDQQMTWLKQCITEYPNPPNITNNDLFYGPVDNLWQNAMKQKHGELEDSESSLDYTHLLDKLAWCTLGYQYQWTERKYLSSLYAPFPQPMAKLCSSIANITGYAPYHAEAAIVNFYSCTSSMGGHLDNAEHVMYKPIISMSFGSTAVFLLGGETKDIEPTPIFIKSGDILIMGGRARECYHGVARILEDSAPQFMYPDNLPEEDRDIGEYITNCRRVNINIRQVYQH